MSDRAAIVLVHGAWHGAWCWETLIPLLENEGRRVIAPDLPGHGDNPLPVNRVTLKRYTDFLTDTIRSLNSPVILAGHSMSGMVISAVAASLAADTSSVQPIERLVYINAYLPVDGDSVFSLVENLDEDSRIAAAMLLSADKRSYTLTESSLNSLFYNKTPDSCRAQALAGIQAQASLPLGSRLSLNQRLFSRIRKTAICAVSDNVIPLAMQYRMLSRQPCDEFIQTDGDHSLFYSAPVELARLINSQ